MTFTVHNLERLSLAGMIEFVEGNRGVRFAVRGVVQVGNGNLGQPLVIGVAENLEFALQECRTAGPDRSSWPLLTAQYPIPRNTKEGHFNRVKRGDILIES